MRSNELPENCYKSFFTNLFVFKFCTNVKDACLKVSCKLQVNAAKLQNWGTRTQNYHGNSTNIFAFDPSPKQ